MHVLIILGSPRKGGNSEILSRSLAEGITQGHDATVEFIRVNDLRISACQGCGGCNTTGNCVINDDMTSLYDKVDLCDCLVLASPIYFYGISAQCKAFIDRFQARWARKYLLQNRFRREDQRRGFLLATAATHGQKVFDGALLTARTLFDALDMVFGDSLLARGVDQKGAMLNQPELLQQAVVLGRLIVSGAPHTPGLQENNRESSFQ